MNIKLLAEKGSQNDIHIFADVFATIASDVNLTATPITFRVVPNFYEQTDGYDPVKGALLTLPVEVAKEFAEQILKICM